MRIGKREQAARDLCGMIAESGRGVVGVTWVRSRTWGSTPQIWHGGQMAATASGCGYCKLSFVLAEALRHLGTTDEDRSRIHGAGGAGVSSVQQALTAAGWSLDRSYENKETDVFTLARL